MEGQAGDVATFTRRVARTARSVNGAAQAAIGVATLAIGVVGWWQFGPWAGATLALAMVLAFVVRAGLGAERDLVRVREEHAVEVATLRRDVEQARVEVRADLDLVDLEAKQARMMRVRERHRVNRLYDVLLDGEGLLDGLLQLDLSNPFPDIRRGEAPSAEMREAEHKMWTWWRSAAEPARELFPEVASHETVMAVGGSLGRPPIPGQPKPVLTEGDVLSGYVRQVQTWCTRWRERVEEHYRTLPVENRSRRFREGGES